MRMGFQVPGGGGARMGGRARGRWDGWFGVGAVRGERASQEVGMTTEGIMRAGFS